MNKEINIQELAKALQVNLESNEELKKNQDIIKEVKY